MSGVKHKILRHLRDLPEATSVQPQDLVTGVGLSKKQLNPSLTAMKRRGEVETLADGSLRLTTTARNRIREGKDPLLFFLPDAMSVPLAVINRAIPAVPAVKYALGVAGIAAAGAVAYWLLKNSQDPRVWRVVASVISGGLIFMVLLFVFARMIEVRGPIVRVAGIVFLWFVLTLFMVICILLVLSAVISWPHPVWHYFPTTDGGSTESHKSTTESLSVGNLREFIEGKYDHERLLREDDMQFLFPSKKVHYRLFVKPLRDSDLKVAEVANDKDGFQYSISISLAFRIDCGQGESLQSVNADARIQFDVGDKIKGGAIDPGAVPIPTPPPPDAGPDYLPPALQFQMKTLANGLIADELKAALTKEFGLADVPVKSSSSDLPPAE